jgi:hypothetical protein
MKGNTQIEHKQRRKQTVSRDSARRVRDGDLVIEEGDRVHHGLVGVAVRQRSGNRRRKTGRSTRGLKAKKKRQKGDREQEEASEEREEKTRKKEKQKE